MRPLRVPVLMYHRLGPPRPESIVPGHYVGEAMFDRHLRLLRVFGMRTVSLETMRQGLLEGGPLPKRPLVVTFDDGYESFATLGLPALRRHGMAATVFLVSDYVGGRNEWDLAKGDVEERLMGRPQILAADDTEFGAHTCRHADLTAVGPDLAEREIRRSKEALEAWLERPVSYFCYPYGHESPRLREVVREAGYLGATGVQLGTNRAATDPYAWRRINVRHNFTTSRFLRRLFQAYRR